MKGRPSETHAGGSARSLPGNEVMTLTALTVRPFLGSLRKSLPAQWRLLSAYTAVTAAVIVYLLYTYYTPFIRIPATGTIKTFQIYTFSTRYTEDNSQYYTARTIHEPSGTTLEFTFPAQSRFRFDFLQDGSVGFAGTLTIVTRGGLGELETTYRFDPGKLFSHALRLNQNGGFDFKYAQDPFIDVPIDNLDRLSVHTVYSACPILYLLGPICIAAYLYRFRRDLTAHLGVTLGMCAVCVFIGLLAATLPYNHGPDESAHIWSGQWYLTHTLPPSMASPIYYDAYWGWDYLIGSPDLTYLLTFKLAHAIDMLGAMDLYTEARVSQLLLIFGCFLLTLRFTRVHVAWACLLSAVLIPQIAYTMTYVNGDALSYFMSLAALGLVAAPKAVDSRVATVVAIFILCNVKLNYIVLIPVALYLIYKHYGLAWWPYVVVGGLLGSYKRVFAYVDSHNIGRTFLQNELLHCSPAFHDRLLRGGLDYGVLSNSDFYKMSLKSLYAVFAALNYRFPWYFYVFGLGVVLLLLVTNNWEDRLLILGCFVANLALSLYFSMSIEYQPQGRYLIPTLTVLFLSAAKHDKVNKYLWYGVPTAIALLSFWFFSLSEGV